MATMAGGIGAENTPAARTVNLASPGFAGLVIETFPRKLPPANPDRRTCPDCLFHSMSYAW